MGTSIFPAPHPLRGLEPLAQLGQRNGVLPPGDRQRLLAWYANAILARRKKVIFRWHARPTSVYNTAAAADTLRFRWHSSPNLNNTRCRMVVVPCDPVAGHGTSDPRMVWTTTQDGESSVAQATLRHAVFVANGSTITPSQYAVIDQDWTSITANASHQAVLNQADNLRVISATAWETPSRTLDTSTDVVVDPRPFYVGGPIYDVDVADLYATLTTLFQKQGTNHFNWSVPSTAAQTRTGATSYVNALDLTSTDWGAATPGFYTWPQYHGSADSVTAGNRETVKGVFWAYVAISDAASTVTAALVDENNLAAAPIATVTRTGAATGAFVNSGVVSWSVPSNTAYMKLDVLLKTSNAAHTASLWQCGFYELET